RDIIIELVHAQASSLKAPAISIPLAQVPQYSNEAFHGNAALNTMSPPQSGAVAQADQMQAQPAPDNFIDFLKHKFETLVLPEVLKLSQSFDYRWVIGSFVLLYVILVTGLSIVPMIRVTQSSIEQESQRRAMTIAQG